MEYIEYILKPREPQRDKYGVYNPIETLIQVTIHGDKIDTQTSIDAPAVLGMIQNAPGGLDIEAQSILNVNDTSFTLVVKSGSVPAAVTSDPIEIVIPGEILDGGVNITVTENTDAKWDIRGADGGAAIPANPDFTLYYDKATRSLYKNSASAANLLNTPAEITINADGSLIFNNFHFSTTAQNAMRLSDAVTIKQEGNNTITSTWTSSDGYGSSYGVDFRGALSFEGSGQLTVTAGDTTYGSSVVFYDYNGNGISVKSGTATAIGGTGATSQGFAGVGIIVSGTGTLVAKGNTDAIYADGEPDAAAKGSADIDGTANQNLVWSDGAGRYYIEGTTTSAKHVKLRPVGANFDAPTATVDDVTISGTVGQSLGRNYKITIRIAGDEIASGVRAQDIMDAISRIFTNAPTGINIALGSLDPTELVFSVLRTNVPTAALSAPIAITIPGSLLKGGQDITVTANPGAKWDIKGVEAPDGDVNVRTLATGNAPASTLPDPDAVRGAVLTEQDHADIANGSTINISLEVSEHNPPDGDKQAVGGALGGRALGMYLDISMFKQKDDEPKESIERLNAPIQFGLDVPAALRSTGRIFNLIRVHEGAAALLPNLSTDPNKILSETDRFSTYAIVYMDAATPRRSIQLAGDSPQTGDDAPIGLWIALLAAASLAIGVTLVKRRNQARGRG